VISTSTGGKEKIEREVEFDTQKVERASSPEHWRGKKFTYPDQLRRMRGRDAHTNTKTHTLTQTQSHTRIHMHTHTTSFTSGVVERAGQAYTGRL